jgi:hypothetical protein
MKTTPEHDARIASITFSSVYPHYLAKLEKKGRSREELHQVIRWLTGYDEKSIEYFIQKKVSFKEFFTGAK